MNFKYGEFFKYIEAEQLDTSAQPVQDNGNNSVANSVAPTNDTKVGNQVQGTAQPTSREDRTALITKYVDNYFNKSNNGKTGDGIGWNYSGANEGTKKILDLAKKWTIDNLSNSTINMKTLPMEVSKFADSAVHQAQAKMAQDAEKQAEQPKDNGQNGQESTLQQEQPTGKENPKAQGENKGQDLAKEKSADASAKDNTASLINTVKKQVSDVANALAKSEFNNNVKIVVESLKMPNSSLKILKEGLNDKTRTTYGTFTLQVTVKDGNPKQTQNTNQPNQVNTNNTENGQSSEKSATGSNTPTESATQEVAATGTTNQPN